MSFIWLYGTDIETESHHRSTNSIHREAVRVARDQKLDQGPTQEYRRTTVGPRIDGRFGYASQGSGKGEGVRSPFQDPFYSTKSLLEN